MLSARCATDILRAAYSRVVDDEATQKLRAHRSLGHRDRANLEAPRHRKPGGFVVSGYSASMAEPAPVSLRLRQGTTFRWQGTYKVGADVSSAVPVNISGYSATAVVRLTSASLVFTTGDGSLSLNASGVIMLTKPASVVSALPLEKGSWFLEWTPPAGDTSVLLSGSAEVVPEGWHQQ